ncbi:hypothetical protein ZOD2009_09900 [Haladaptatus paucihalophilus DX253]|uniref:Uncharacterized protein n=1 Tax=Haladaptatus paucihalophilus DX253 TaxID=797209 RepID=E7QSX2_HALPU|nr:hypothetical protein ZOD2009_09900 [Haladaptatus paucihalophilus DX253]
MWLMNQMIQTMIHLFLIGLIRLASGFMILER